MIFLQVVSLLVLVFVIVLMYATTIKLVNDHRDLHRPESTDRGQQEDQDNLDLTNKQ